MGMLSPVKLKAISREEKATGKRYIKLGFKKQGKQELAHSKFFNKLSRKGKM